ncbi:MAG: hypothetical protein ACNA71_00470 [Kiritimatiellia bacterium]
MKEDHQIVAIHVTDRLSKAQTVQALLTEFGNHIKTRLGLHEFEPDATGPNGILILEMIGGASPCQQLLEKLNQIAGIEAKLLTFTH